MKQLTIQNNSYAVLDEFAKINIADSFVLPQNKIGGGNGEAKLYIGHVNTKLIAFFGERGFQIKCLLSKQNLLNYLDNAYSEYIEPQQEYRYKNDLSSKWQIRKEKVLELNETIEFNLSDQDQIVGPRVYVSSHDIGYNMIREISLPVISFLNVYKLQDLQTNNVLYYFKLFFNDAFDDLEVAIPKPVTLFDERYNPTTDKEVENELRDIELFSNIDTPFNPNKIKVRTAPSSIGQIIEDLYDKFINLDTEFQRLPNLWDLEKKSRFIESLLLRLPIPAFYFNEKEENNLEVVDGLQRISTIKSFVIDKNFKLTNLEFLKEFEGSWYDELPTTLTRRIKTFPITTYVIEKGTPDEVKFNIFKRVNTGGLILTAQEIRHAINQGTPSTLISELVRGEDLHNSEGIISLATPEGIAFVRATNYKIGSFRMEDRDFATRFVAFYLQPFQNYKPDLDTFLNNGMSKIKELSIEEIKKLKADFLRSMNVAYSIFQDDAFRKRFDRNDSRKPINKALFEVLSVSFSKLSDVEATLLRTKGEQLVDKFIEIHNSEDGSFLRSITQGTAQKDNVVKRFTEIERIINETIYND